jgi:hypothetical protein
MQRRRHVTRATSTFTPASLIHTRVVSTARVLLKTFVSASQLFSNCALASSKFATRARAGHGRVDGQRPEPAQTIGTAAGLIDAANTWPTVATA